MWDSSVGIAMGYRFDSLQCKIFLFSTASRPTLGPSQILIKWVPPAFSPGVKRQGREADHSPAPIAKEKKMWTYTSTPPYVELSV
jgi:hypothetical protein